MVTDDYSRYPVVEFVNSTSSHHVIPVLDKIFSMFGVPEIVKSDNGPPFQGGEFHKYAQYLGFTHRKITPYHPRANGECERFMRTLGKVVKIAATELQPLNQILCRFLRSYRATPHSTTSIAPATALFSRPIRVRLREMKHLRVQNDDKIRNKDTVKKEKIRKYADDKRYVKKFPVQIGDEVLLKNAKKSVTQSYYEKDPFIVIDVKGNMITAQRNEQKVTRNATHFKKIDSENEFDDLNVNQDNRDKSDIKSTPVRSAINTRSKSGYVAKHPTRYNE